MDEKNRKTFLVIYESQFRNFKPHRTKFLVLDTPSEWDLQLLSMFLDARSDELKIYQDYRVADIFELTENLDEDSMGKSIFKYRPYVDSDLRNLVNMYIKIESMDKYEISDKLYQINGFKNRGKSTSIIHIVHDNLFNTDTGEIDKMIQKYILTSNTITSFNRVSHGQVLDTLANDYHELSSVNDITLVFHDLTFAEIVDVIRGWYELMEEGINFHLDLFVVDNSNQVYQLITRDDGFDVRLCFR